MGHRCKACGREFRKHDALRQHRSAVHGGGERRQRVVVHESYGVPAGAWAALPVRSVSPTDQTADVLQRMADSVDTMTRGPVRMQDMFWNYWALR